MRYIFLIFIITITYLNGNTTINLLKSEKDYLTKKKNIKMCIDPNWMPFESFDKNGKHIGIIKLY